MSNTHTIEPWSAYEEDEELFIGHTGRQEDIAIISLKLGDDTAVANAKRIVSCVNAMAGIANPEFYIKEQSNALKAALSLVNSLTQERDELREALKKFVRNIETGTNAWEDIVKFKDLLTKYEGGNNG